MTDTPCVDSRPRWRRRLARPAERWRSRPLSWHAWCWYQATRAFGTACFGDPGPFGDWGSGHASVVAVHRWLCRRWAPEWDAYLARRRAS